MYSKKVCGMNLATFKRHTLKDGRRELPLALRSDWINTDFSLIFVVVSRTRVVLLVLESKDGSVRR